MSEEIYDMIDSILDDVLATSDYGEERGYIRDCLVAFRTMRADNERFIARIADMAEAWYQDGSIDNRDGIVKSAMAGDKECIEYMKAWSMVFSDEEHELVNEAVAVEEFRRTRKELMDAKTDEERLVVKGLVGCKWCDGNGRLARGGAGFDDCRSCGATGTMTLQGFRAWKDYQDKNGPSRGGY